MSPSSIQESSIVTTAQETTSTLAGKEGKKPAGTAPKKPVKKSSPRRRKTKPPQRIYDHIPIIIVLVVIFSFTLLCIGIGITRYLDPKRAGIPACGKIPCPSPFSISTKALKRAGESRIPVVLC
ncbi:hypothetical protein H206_03847 [Candidatus Electrothrix aarhusensis]|uniref:Uncharacterized protein n=1 Tax=Candidatus Electrothrix aarhusensis TaxID=1859131 RepID=A0A444J0D4_9BACT|nr:hypothetical protein H206_03847 [Candidatus Electrothrix aarhusensis]